jgi:predicted enzyme related to lactoylglutathione lyase
VSERSEYKPGEFCWVDLATTDVDAAAKFYGDLLGVEAEPAPGDPAETGGYGFFTQREKMVAGYGPVQRPRQPPAWTSYVRVKDADETAAKVKDAGGQVVFGPIDLPADSGRMAICTDSGGAFFGVIQEKQHAGAELVNEIGAWSWNNLMTRDPDQAQHFYGKVFGWEAAHSDDAPEFIWNWQVEGQRWPEGLAGLMAMGSDMPPETPPHWQVYFLVPDLDEAIEKTKGAGGNLLFGPEEVPVAKLAVLTDPQAAAFALMEPDYPEPR